MLKRSQLRITSENKWKFVTITIVLRNLPKYRHFQRQKWQKVIPVFSEGEISIKLEPTEVVVVGLITTTCKWVWVVTEQWNNKFLSKIAAHVTTSIECQLQKEIVVSNWQYRHMGKALKDRLSKNVGFRNLEWSVNVFLKHGLFWNYFHEPTIAMPNYSKIF